LDHVQAIIGRFDNFFYLSKQVCLAAFGYLAIHTDHNFDKYIIILPVLFFLMGESYRFFYWSKYVLRVHEIRKDINNGSGLYEYRISPLVDNITWRYYKSVQPYDVLFYGALLSLAVWLRLGFYLGLVIFIVVFIVTYAVHKYRPKNEIRTKQ
jgi:hypothetical protein